MSRPLDSFPDVSTFPDIECPGRVALLKSIPSGKALEQARDWPFMSPEEYDKKWNSIQGPETDPLAAEQAASIASNLEVGSGTEENLTAQLMADNPPPSMTEINHYADSDGDIFGGDIPEPPESEEEPEKWEPRDMKTTVITRDNIDHFNNPFA